MKVFLSHKWQDKKTVKSIKSHLEKAFIKCWLDEEQVEGGVSLHSKLINAIDDCDILVAFISEQYLDSIPCVEEFKHARISQKRIIVYLIGDATAIKNKAKEKNITEISSNLSQNVYKTVDEYKLDVAAQNLLSDIQANEKIKFDPITTITIGDTKLQHIQIKHDNNLDDDFLSHWKFDAKDFLCCDSTDLNVIKRDMPVAISGRSPQWLIAHLVIGFANNRDVFIYNNISQAFIGVYSCSKNDNVVGRVLPYTI
jgi:hypothetical protein